MITTRDRPALSSVINLNQLNSPTRTNRVRTPLAAHFPQKPIRGKFMVGTPQYFRQLATRCRRLHEIATKPQVKAQLLQWALEFDREAEALENARPEQEAADN